jgi:uncharacterized protein YjiS (DUF1127 family)
MPEKVMRTLSSTTARLQSVATQLQSWWVVYLEWRIQREAMLQLEALGDRELHDIGVRRCEIEGVVKSGLQRERAFSRYH